MSFSSRWERHSTRRKARRKAPALGPPRKRREVPSQREALGGAAYARTRTSWKPLSSSPTQRLRLLLACSPNAERSCGERWGPCPELGAGAPRLPQHRTLPGSTEPPAPKTLPVPGAGHSAQRLPTRSKLQSPLRFASPARAGAAQNVPASCPSPRRFPHLRPTPQPAGKTSWVLVKAARSAWG